MKNKYILYGIGAVLVLGAIIIISVRSSSGHRTLGEATTTGEEAGATTAQKNSLKGLLAAATPQKCTFTRVATSSTAKGTVYVSGGKMRGDFEFESNGKTMTNHMIVEDQTGYTWSEALPQGFKLSLADIEKPNADPQKTVDLNQETDYSCTPWVSDESVFVRPANITFTDMSSMMASSTLRSGVGSKELQCSACNSVPDESSRTRCRAALNCK